MSMAVKGSVHSAISMSPAFNPVRALRTRSAGKGHLSPRKLSIFSATSFSACAPAIASTFRRRRQYNMDTNDVVEVDRPQRTARLTPVAHVLAGLNGRG